MPDFAEYFEQALAEHDIDASVKQVEDPLEDKFLIAKPIGDELLTYEAAVNMRINTTDDQIRKEILQQARLVAEKFEEELTETFEWDERRVTISPHEGGWAECDSCGNRARLPSSMVTFFEGAELSTPHPLPRDRESAISSMDDESRLMLKLFLIGQLRRSCAHDCRNNWLRNHEKSAPYHTERFK